MMTLPLKRIARFGALAVLLAGAAACSDFLDVKNPGSVDADKLTDENNANLLVAGAIGEFQGMVSSAAVWGGVLGDELLNGHNNASYGPIDRRDFTNLNDIVAGVYSPPARARFSADSTADRLKAWFPETAGSDLRVARMLALAGYGYIYLGEMFCAAPIQMSAPLEPDALFERSQPRFDEAIAIATAYRATAGANVAAADTVINLARVGAARAALNRGDAATAKTYAALVPADFEYRAYYAEGIPPAAGNPTNLFWSYTGAPNTATASEIANSPNSVDAGIRYSAVSAWLSVAEPFQGLNDPRVTHTSKRMIVLNSRPGEPSQFIPNKPKSFGGYVAPDATRPTGAAMTPGASIRVASGLEAAYVVAEADGGVQSTLDFVNAQRAANGQVPSTAATPDEILADLRDQKRREFYLDGRRLGEMRRLKTFAGIDLFQHGQYLGGDDQYGDVECFPIPLSEINSNPNVPRG